MRTVALLARIFVGIVALVLLAFGVWSLAFAHQVLASVLPLLLGMLFAYAAISGRLGVLSRVGIPPYIPH